MKSIDVEVYKVLEGVCDYEVLSEMSGREKKFLRDNKEVVKRVMNNFDWVNEGELIEIIENKD